MDQEFERHIQEIGEKMKALLDLATEKEWIVDVVIEIWDVSFECTIKNFPDFVFQSRYIEYGRHRDYVERFGWDEYAISFANEARYYFQNTCFRLAKETLGLKECVIEG